MNLETLLTKLAPQIKRLCRQDHDGEDLYQDVWMRCLVSGRDREWSPALLMTIARNLLRDGFRHKKCERTYLFQRADYEACEAISRFCGQDAEEQESRVAIRQQISQLPDIYRECLEAILSNDGTKRCAATSLGIEPATFRTRARRAKQLLARS